MCKDTETQQQKREKQRKKAAAVLKNLPKTAFPQSQGTGKPFCKITDYLSNVNITGKLIENLISGKNTTLQAPAGSGKSHLVLNTIAPLLNQLGYTVVFACPFKAQRDQVKEDVVKYGLEVFVHEPEKRAVKQIEKKDMSVVCTYDKLEQAVNALLDVNEANAAKTVLIVDESQFLTKSRSFRKGAIDRIEKVMRFTSLHSTLFISATPNTALDRFLGFETVRVDRASNPVFHFTFRIKGKSQVDDLFNEAAFHLSRGKKVFLMLNNYGKLNAVKRALVSAGLIGSHEAAVYSGETMRAVSDDFKELSKNSQFPSDVRLVLATEVIKQAVNVRNRGFHLIYCPATLQDSDARDLIQFVNRMRNSIERCILLSCTVFVGVEFVLREPKPNRINEYKALVHFWGMSDRTTRLTNQFRGAKLDVVQDPVEVNAKIFSPKFSPIYDREGNKHYSILSAAQEAEQYRLRMMCFSDYVQDIADLSPRGTVFFRHSENRALDIAPDVVASAIADAIELEKEVKAAAIGGLVSDLKADMVAVLGFYKNNASDVNTASRLKVAGHDNEPPTFNEYDNRYYMQALSGVVKAYNTGFYSNDELISFLENGQAKTNDPHVINTPEKAANLYKMAMSLAVVHANKNTDLPKEVNQLFFERNRLFRYSLNLLHSVVDELKVLGLAPLDEQLDILRRKLDAKRQKLKDDPAHKGRHETAIKKLEAKIIHAERDCSVKLSLSDIFEHITTKGKHSEQIKTSNFSERDLSLLLTYFTNIQSAKTRKKGEGFEVRGSVSISFANMAKALEMSQNELKAKLGEELYNAFDKIEDKVLAGETLTDRNTANAVAKGRRAICTDVFGYAPPLPEPCTKSIDGPGIGANLINTIEDYGMVAEPVPF